MRSKLLSLFCLGLAPLAAFASGESIKVAEIFPGAQIDITAQYIMLRAAANEQGDLAGQRVTIQDSFGITTSYTFSGNLSNGNNQGRILLATPSAESFFGIEADLEIEPVIDLYGGTVCFGDIDCVSWGYTENVATDNSAPHYDYLRYSEALTRDITRSGDPFLLELEDDTNDSSADFFLDYPAPVNNLGTTGKAPASTCGDYTLQGLESCDDGNGLTGDGCDQCQAEEFYGYCGFPCSAAPASSGFAWLPVLGFLGFILLRRRQGRVRA